MNMSESGFVSTGGSEFRTIRGIGFVGLGVMGSAMAGHLLGSGLPVFGFNRSPEKVERWLLRFPQGRGVASLADLAGRVEVLFLCVGNDDDVRSTVHAVLPHLARGCVIVDHTTTSADLAREMYALCAAQGVAFLDCPVSGGQVGAERGTLTIMAGGDAAALAHVAPLLDVYAQRYTHFGGAGAGQGAKMVNQVLVVNVLQGLAEGLRLAQSLDLDVPSLVETLSKGAANSWQLEHRGVTMTQGAFDFGFAVDWAIKDLGIVLDCARAQGLSLQSTERILGIYQGLSAQGFGREDTSALIRQFDGHAQG